MADSTWLGAHELCTMNHERYLEAAPGLEPGNKGFADLCLGHLATPPRHPWSGKRDLTPRPSPWQGDALPLSYSRTESTATDTRISGACQTQNPRIHWLMRSGPLPRPTKNAISSCPGSKASPDPAPHPSTYRAGLAPGPVLGLTT